MKSLCCLAPAVALAGCTLNMENSVAKYPYIVAAEQFSTSFIVIDPNVDVLKNEAIVWRYAPIKDWDVPEDKLRTFSNPSEVKIVKDGTKLLLTCSGGACALIDLATGKYDWLVFPYGNPHSAELLPDGNVVTASSTGAYLRLYDLKKDIKGTVSKKYPLESAHGVVWDKKTELLYACGKHGIVSYKYDPEKVELTQVKEYNLDLPDLASGGHDLYLDPRDGKLLVTVTRGMVKVDQESGKFEVITPQRHIKSVSVAPGIGTLVMIPTESWWSDKLGILDEQGVIKDFIRMPHMRFYKARWIPDMEKFQFKK